MILKTIKPTLLMILFMGGILNATAQKNINNEKITEKDTVVEVIPEFPGGEDSLWKFISKNVVYPEEARKKNLEGKVVIKFIIETDGSISNVEVVQSVAPILDEEAVRVIKLMPKWKPGKQRGKFVRVYFQIPIRFSLN